MKVILLQDVENVGKKYEVKEVKDGHARNFLLAQNLAKVANDQNLEWLETQKETMAEVLEEDLKKHQELASKLDGLDVAFPVKVGEHGELFEAITVSKIVEKLSSMGFEVKKSHVKLEEPIKELGEYPVKVNLDHNLEVEINILVTKGEGDEE